MISLLIGGKQYECLVDTGATASLIVRLPGKDSIMLGAQDNIMGVEGQTIPVEFTKEIKVELGPFSLTHSFIICPQSPVSLLGRDLCKLDITIGVEREA